MRKWKNRRCQSCGELFKCSDATLKSKPCTLGSGCTYKEKIDRCGRKLYFVQTGEVYSFEP